MSASPFSKQGAINFGFETTKKNLSFFIPLLLIVFFVNMTAGMFANGMHQSAFLAFVFKLVGWLLQMLTSLGLVVVALKFVDKKKASYSDLWQHTDVLFPYIIGSIVYGIMVAVGFVLFIIPGIYLAVTYGFYSYLIIDKKMGPIDAIKKSADLTRGVKIDLLLLYLLFIGIVIVGALALFVGLFVAIPTVMLAQAYVYRKLS